MTFLTLDRKAKYIFNAAVWRPNASSFAMNNKRFVTSNMTADSRDLNCVAFWHTPVWENPELTAIQRHVTTGRVNFPKPCLSGDTNTIPHFTQRVKEFCCFWRRFTMLEFFIFVSQLSFVSVVKVKLKWIKNTIAEKYREFTLSMKENIAHLLTFRDFPFVTLSQDKVFLVCLVFLQNLTNTCKYFRANHN